MNKTVTILKIVLLSLLIVILVGGMILFMNDKFSFSFGSKAELIYDQNITESFDKLYLTSESLDYKFVKSTDNTVNVKVYDNKDNDVSVSVENNTLKVISNNQKKCFFCFTSKREAIIALPEKLYDVTLETKSGDITSSINFNKAEINTTSGDIELNNVKDAIINVTSGDIKIDAVDSLAIKSTSGDVEINKINKYLNIETTSGDIVIKDLTILANSSIKVTSGDIDIYKASNDIYYNTSVKSGDVRVNNNNRKANYELNIETTSGDITVKN